MNSIKPHILQRLSERYASAQWSMEDVAAIEDQIRDGQIIYSASQNTNPSRKVVCLNYGCPEPLLLVVCKYNGYLITALPPKQRAKWNGRALLQLTSTHSTQALQSQKENTYAS
jgi:hypothetical protein